MTSRTSNCCPLGGVAAEPWPLKDWPFASSWTLTSLAFHHPGCNFSTYSVLIVRFSSKSLSCLETTAIMAEDCHPPLTAISLRLPFAQMATASLECIQTFTDPPSCNRGYSFSEQFLLRTWMDLSCEPICERREFLARSAVVPERSDHCRNCNRCRYDDDCSLLFEVSMLPT
jgi:hypothetical protein